VNRGLWSALAASGLLVAGACGTETLGGDGADGTDDLARDAAPPDAEPAFVLDLFGEPGATFRFDISSAMATAMDNRQFGGGGGGDPYQVGGVDEDYLYADDLTVTTPAGASHSFGKTATWTVGQSTFRAWDGIPNIRVDAGRVAGGDIGGYEDFRFNNGQVGSIYREAIALRVWDALGVPTPQTSFAWVEAPNQWGEQRVPMTLVEVYKTPWCDREVDGGCVNMWEGYGEPWWFVDNPETCQIGECDNTRLAEFRDVANSTPAGPGYAAALSDYFDWDMFRAYACLSWITCTGDDYIHNTNNVVLVERADGKFQLHPYSTDISAGQSWYPETDLRGWAQLASGCQNDPDCWNATLDKCDEILDEYVAIDVPGTIVKPVLDLIETEGMMRDGDAARAQEIYDWYLGREQQLRSNFVWTMHGCDSPDDCDPGYTCDLGQYLCVPN
jgi:hypothetical protein